MTDVEARYVWADYEGFWVDTTKPWQEPGGTFDGYEEVDPGEVMNRQEAELQEAQRLLRELEEAFQESAKEYTHQWTYRLQCAIEATRAFLGVDDG